MSKGNMLLGYARGKMGDIVFARVKGQQIQRPRNRQPNNPRSSQQMYQRSLFACAVSFFSKGRQALFQYAFESKKSTESDYNAFIRLNAKNGVHMTKDMLDNIYYPKLGNYIMTQGSLPGYESQFLASERKFCCFLTDVQSAAAADDITIGEISQQLIASGNYEYGDIITILQIKSDSYFEEGSDPIPVVWEEGKPVRWILDQFILNPNSTTKVNTVLRNVKVSKRDVELDDTVTIESSALSSAYDEIGGFCVVHSRKTSSGLKVSTTTLTNSTGAQLALAKCATQEYIDYVLVDWQSRAEAVLEGSLTAPEIVEYETKFAQGFYNRVTTSESGVLPHVFEQADASKIFVLTDENDAPISINSIDEIKSVAGNQIASYSIGNSMAIVTDSSGNAFTLKVAEGTLTLEVPVPMSVPLLSIVKKK